MNTRLLFGLLWLTPTLCFGALSTDTSYFLNVEALTNVTARSAVVAQKAFQSYQGTLTHSGTVTLNFDATTTVNSITLTGNLAVAFSNLVTNRTYRLKIEQPQATNCLLSLPSGTQGFYTTNLANGWHMLSAESWGTVASNVWVSTSSNGRY